MFNAVTLQKPWKIFKCLLEKKSYLAKKERNHIVPHRKFDRIGGTSSKTFSNFKYVAPREICVERNCFDCPIAKLELEQIFDVESSREVP